MTFSADLSLFFFFYAYKEKNIAIKGFIPKLRISSFLEIKIVIGVYPSILKSPQEGISVELAVGLPSYYIVLSLSQNCAPHQMPLFWVAARLH